MGYQLASHLHCGIVDDVAIFLDVRADRFFALPDDDLTRVRRLVGGTSNSEHSEDAPALMRAGLIETDERPRRAAMLRPNHSTLRELERCRVAPANLFAASLAVAIARVRLKLVGLEDTLAQLTSAKRRIGPSTPAQSPAIASRVASAFRATGLVMSSHDRCLPNSVALARALIRRSCPASLVVAVQIRPFRAHCWVEFGELLLNDSPDAIAGFTPILVI